MSIFQRILCTSAMSAIEFLAERELPNATPADQVFLRKILEENKLDGIYAICHDQLGNTEEAAHLRQWLASRPERKVADELDALLAE